MLVWRRFFPRPCGTAARSCCIPHRRRSNNGCSHDLISRQTLALLRGNSPSHGRWLSTTTTSPGLTMTTSTNPIRTRNWCFNNQSISLTTHTATTNYNDTNTTSSSSSSSSSSSMTTNSVNDCSSDTMDSFKHQLLNAAIQCVPQYGWTKDAIAMAACQMKDGYSMAKVGLITVPELVHFCMDQWNEQLRKEIMIQNGHTNKDTNITTLTDQIIWAFQNRLSYEQEFISSGRWQEGMAIGVHPNCIDQTRNQLANLIDIVLTGINAPTEQFSFMDRLSLGAVFVSVELHMLSDQSIDCTDTWIFLQHQVQNWNDLRPYSSGASSLVPIHIPNILQYHSPSDMAFTASVIGSALGSGFMSIFFPNSSKSSTTTKASSSSSSSSNFSRYGVRNDFDGSHPSHYDPPPSSTVTTMETGK